MKYYIGIDIGTSSVKLTCIDENAKVAGESSREYKIEEQKSGWKDPHDSCFDHFHLAAFHNAKSC